jgi:phosphoribosyl 1,2-cyclic phosphodiesterase
MCNSCFSSDLFPLRLQDYRSRGGGCRPLLLLCQLCQEYGNRRGARSGLKPATFVKFGAASLRDQMRLTFLGTRGEIEARTRLHRMHSSLLVADDGCEVMIDCGVDWLERVMKLHPNAIFLTHAHSDHAGGLKNAAPCEVFATRESWKKLRTFAIRNRSLVTPHKPIKIGDVTVEAFPVEHSLVAPAVGYRVTCTGRSIFYVPDVASVPELSRALSGISVYIGDGATVTRPLVRKRDGALIGHAPISVQLQWCEQENIGKAVFTHCGSQIVRGDKRAMKEKIRALGREVGIDTRIAYDGFEMTV